LDGLADERLSTGKQGFENLGGHLGGQRLLMANVN
jgi:hypothetical protein